MISGGANAPERLKICARVRRVIGDVISHRWSGYYISYIVQLGDW